MASGKLFLCAALVLSCGSYRVAAEPTTAPSTQPVEKPMVTKRLTSPWNLIKSLTPEQITQIEKLHSDSYEQMKKIDAKEGDDIKALLTPDQVTELKTAQDKIKADRKERMAKRKKDMATTAPAQ